MALPEILLNQNLGLIAETNLGLLFMEVLLFVSSIFLMLLILVQRGKGGGLTGALGGMGGQSAFGSKAGDAFTKITVITAMIWIMLCMVTIAAFNPPPAPKKSANNAATLEAGIDDALIEESLIEEGGPDAATSTGTSENGAADDSATDDNAAGDDESDGVQLDLGGPDGSDGESTGASTENADPTGDGN